MTLDKPINNITKTDLDDLIGNRVVEGTALEYKESLSLDKPEEKKEFLRDITAFANSRGGHIVCGIREGRDKGVPEELCGIPLVNPDQWKQRIENLIRDGTAPRVYGMQIGDPIDVGNERFAVVIRIPHSFNAPHTVLCGDDRFYYRTNAGRERLDVVGLRMLFGMADTIAARTQTFRADRLSRIQSGDTPVPLAHGSKCVLHLVPFDAFTVQARYDLSGFAARPEELAKAGRWQATSGFERSRYNFDGLVAYHPHRDETQPRVWYTQCFRNGIVEAVNMEHNPRNQDGDKGLIEREYERYVSAAARNYLRLQCNMGVAPPVFALLTLLDMKGRKLSYRPYVDAPGTVECLPGAVAFREEQLVLPEIVFESFDCDVAEQMEPVFEIVWNAVGLSRKG
jgi:hypothetical protein